MGHAHRAEQVVLGVDDRTDHQVVRREVAGDLAEGRLGGQAGQVGVDDARHQQHRRVVRDCWVRQPVLDGGQHVLLHWLEHC